MKQLETSVTIVGTITDAQITEPINDFFEEKLRFEFRVRPDDPFEFEVIEARVSELIEAHKDDLKQKPEHDSQPRDHKSVIVDGLSFVFQTFFPVKMRGVLSEMNDEQLRNRRVSVLGNIRVLADGNAVLSPSQVVDAPITYDDFDFDEDEEDW